MNNNHDLPKVTIMIPTYGQEQYIAEAVESALAQNYDNLEVVVADDCSPDNTREVVRRYAADARLRYVRNSPNLGRVGNYHNTAHNVATGEWAVNLDGDDYYTSKTFVRDAMEAIAANADKDIVAYCYRHPHLDYIKAVIPYKEIDADRILVSGKDYFLNYYRIGAFGHPNIIFRRDLGVGINLYTLPYQACDFHSLIRIFLLGNIILDRRVIAYWRVHGTNTTIKEVDVKQEHAMLTFDAIEEFAKDYVSAEELKTWREGMNRSSYIDFIQSYVSCRRNIKAAWLLITNFHNRYWWYRGWAKLILGR